jgi:circadian clock protein KaiC
VRELVLSDQGLALTDVYAQGGAVLMGTARLEKEQADRADEEQRRREAALAQQEIEEAEARLKAKQDELEAELKALERRRLAMTGAEAARQEARDAAHQQLMTRRHADQVTTINDDAGL